MDEPLCVVGVRLSWVFAAHMATQLPSASEGGIAYLTLV